MAKHSKTTDAELVKAIYDEITQVRTQTFDEISDQRIDSNYSFSNQQTSTTTNNTRMSKVKLFFTPSVVQTLQLQQTKIFCSDKDTVKLVPMVNSEENVKYADQLERAINKVIHKDNPGFEIISEMFLSAGVNKNGFSKVTWGEELEAYEEDFLNMSREELNVEIQKKEEMGYDVELVFSEITQEEVIIEQDDGFGNMMEIRQSSEMGDYTLKFSRTHSKLNIGVIPPEEFLINEDTTSIHHDNLTRYVGHKREMMNGDIQLMLDAWGVKIDVEDTSDYEDLNSNYEKLGRHDFDGTLESYSRPKPVAGPADSRTVVESWVRADRDGDGFPEMRHVFTIGSTLLIDEPWYGPIPMSSFTYFPIPHKFWGMSVYDRIRSYEETATSLIRADVDMNRLKNTFRLLAKEGSVDRRTLQSGKPGVIPVSSTFDPKDVMPVPTPQGASNTAQILQELRLQVTADTGVDPVRGIMSTDIEKSGNDAEKTAMSIDNASIKVEGYSRRFAEGPLRDMTWIIAMELVKNKDSDYVKELIESVTPGEPFYAGEMGLHKIIRKTDITAKVGLGHMTGYQKIAAGTSMLNIIKELEANPTDAMYNLATQTLSGWGYPHPDGILGDLKTYQEKKQRMDMLQQMEVQTAQQQVQNQTTQLQMSQQQMQFEQQLKLSDQQFDQQMRQAKVMAEIEEIEAKTGKTAAEARKIMTETDAVTRVGPNDVRVVL